MCRIKRLSVPARVCISCTPAWICKWNFVWSRWSAHPSAGAEPGYEYKFFLHSSPVAPPDTPPDTKENQLSVCVSVYRDVPPPSFPSLKGIHILCVCVWGGDAEGVQKQKIMSFVAVVTSIAAAVNIRTNEKPREMLGKSICMNLEANKDQRDTDLRYWFAAIVAFFNQLNDHEHFVASASSRGLLTAWVIVTLHSCVFNVQQIHNHSLSCGTPGGSSQQK